MEKQTALPDPMNCDSGQVEISNGNTINPALGQLQNGNVAPPGPLEFVRTYLFITYFHLLELFYIIYK